MAYSSIDDLRSQLGASPTRTPEYVEKMMHEIPSAESVDRKQFLVERCRGKRVLEFGASGHLHEAIKAVASELCGVDRLPGDGVVGFDLDDVSKVALPVTVNFPEVIICGEVIEHLSNPGWFLDRLKRQYAGIPVIVTVPNAFTAVARRHLSNGLENVNRDHCAWYSWRTLKTLVERAGFVIQEFYWYSGEPYVAQGLIMVIH